MSKAKEKALATIEQMRAMGFIPPKLQPIKTNAAYLKVKGIDVPPIIAEFLSRFENHELKVSEPGTLLWECDMDGAKLRDQGIFFMDLSAMYFDAIPQAGGALINVGLRYDLMFPRRAHLMRAYFEQVGFGLDDFVDPLSGKPLAPDLNTPERVQQRRDDALALFDALMAERPASLVGITPTHAYLKTIEPPAEAKWAEAWAEKIWAYYMKHKSSAQYQPREGAMDWYSRKQCFREARTGYFDLGGFP